MNKKSYCKILTIASFNDLLNQIDYLRPEIKVERTIASFTFSGVEYQCSLTGNNREIPNIGNIWNIFNKYCGKSYELPNKEKYGYVKKELDNHKSRIKWDLLDPGNFNYVKENAARKWHNCYSYDLNSAYSYAMLQPLPDTSVEPRLNCILQENEIGFYKDGYATTIVGSFVEYAFPLKIYNFEKFIDTYYAKKKTATTKQEKDKWKFFLNIPCGMMAKYNIFIRLGMLHNAQKYMEQFIDENTIYCNTDSIISTKPRTDLPIGNEIGQFKPERQNVRFKFIQTGIYQWETECHYIGIPGSTLTDIENITGWLNNLPYKVENGRIVKNEKCNAKEIC